MAYAVELLFDEESSKLIRRFWSQLDAEGVSSHMVSSGHPPHISLAGCADLDFAQVSRIEELCRTVNNPGPITLSQISTFPGKEKVFFLGLTPSSELIEFHKNFHKICKDVLKEQNPHYLPASWIPHCTLAVGLDDSQISKFFTLTRGLNLPRRVQLERLAIVEHPGGAIKDSFDLNGFEV